MTKSPEISATLVESSFFQSNFSVPQYCILIFDGHLDFSIDFIAYQATGTTAICLSPYQHFQIKEGHMPMHMLQFHGDFYCIEYHEKEVACNGLLFNAIYQSPYIKLNAHRYQEIIFFNDKIQTELQQKNDFTTSILKSYLQLILSICSAEKSISLPKEQDTVNRRSVISYFQELLEQHFATERSITFYADKMAMSAAHFSKKIKERFNKTPSQIIQERVILEAKKLLHLTHKTIKEIAAELKFDDEFYFSRFFKKVVGLSPLHYREQVGISIVAGFNPK